MLREHNPTASIGDICKYMTDKGWTPPGNWRVPTKAQLDILTTAKLKKSGSWTALSSYNTNGTTSLTSGAMTNRIFIPASAYKRVGNYYDREEVGTRPDFNVSSSRGNNVPWCAYLINSDLTHYINYFSTSSDSWAFPVRCIRVD